MGKRKQECVLGGGEMRVLEGFGEDKEDDKTYYDNFLKSQHKASLTMIPHGASSHPSLLLCNLEVT